jgi:polyhydroxybutyrate depolymerase
VRLAARRWIAAAAIALATGLMTGLVSERIPGTGARGAAHAAARAGRSTRSGGTTPAPTPTPTPGPTPSPAVVTNTYEVPAGGLERTYQVIRPTQPISSHVPALVVLHGVTATLDTEKQRDGLLPVAASGQAVLVYPVGYGQSWNAGVCCEPATTARVDDVDFIAAVMQRLTSDPDIDESRITLVGFSNGGRMAYQVDCAQPGLFTSVVAVLAVPVTPCDSSTPVSFLAIATADDPEVPYASGSGAAYGLTAVTDEVNRWAQRDRCPGAASTRTTLGQLTDQTWPACRWGTEVQLGTYASGGHLWPAGGGATPSAERLVWSFAIAAPGLNDPLPQ